MWQIQFVHIRPHISIACFDATSNFCSLVVEGVSERFRLEGKIAALNLPPVRPGKIWGPTMPSTTRPRISLPPPSQ